MLRSYHRRISFGFSPFHFRALCLPFLSLSLSLFSFVCQIHNMSKPSSLPNPRPIGKGGGPNTVPTLPSTSSSSASSLTGLTHPGVVGSGQQPKKSGKVDEAKILKNTRKDLEHVEKVMFKCRSYMEKLERVRQEELSTNDSLNQSGLQAQQQGRALPSSLRRLNERTRQLHSDVVQQTHPNLSPLTHDPPPPPLGHHTPD